MLDAERFAEQIFMHVLIHGGEGNPLRSISSKWFAQIAAPRIRELLTEANMTTMEEANEFFESGAARENMRSTYREAIPADEKVTLKCNECGKTRKVSPNGTFNDRCPKCGGVDWDVL